MSSAGGCAVITAVLWTTLPFALTWLRTLVFKFFQSKVRTRIAYIHLELGLISPGLNLSHTYKHTRTHSRVFSDVAQS
jgi:hypothetical protein